MSPVVSPHHIGHGMDNRPAMAIFELLDYIVNEVCARVFGLLCEGIARPPSTQPIRDASLVFLYTWAEITNSFQKNGLFWTIVFNTRCKVSQLDIIFPPTSPF